MSRLISRAKRRLAGEETGSALVLAMAFVMVFSILIGVMMSFADTSLRLTGAIRAKDGRTYSADGAVEAAIGHIRYTEVMGRAQALGGTCFGDSTTPPLATTVNGTPMSVHCQGKPGSGALSPGGVNNSNNRPENALLVLGRRVDGSTIAEEGLIVRTDVLEIDGPVHSNTCIATKLTGGCVSGIDGNGRIQVSGTAQAVGECADATGLTATGGVKCANRNPPPPAPKTDPGYALTDAPPSGTSNLACPAGWIKTLSPGVYRDAAALSNLVSCKPGLVVWFQPGTYLFDFAGPGGAACTGASDNSCRWVLENSPLNPVNVVGGTPPPSGDTGHWDPNAATKASPFPYPSAAQQRGACVRPADRPGEAVQGVKFVFAGESRIELRSGTRVELCPSSTAASDTQQIVIQGLQTAVAGGGASGTSIFKAATSPDGPVVSPGTSWAGGGGVNAAAVLEGSCAPAMRCAEAGGTATYGAAWAATITTRSVTPTPVIPAGATIGEVRIRFGRQIVRDGGGASFSRVVPGFFSNGTWYDCAHQNVNNENYNDPTCVPQGLSTLGQADLRTAVDNATQFRFDVRANSGKNPTMKLDGMELEVDYSFPTIPPQSGCVVTPVSDGGCPFISQLSATLNVRFWNHGTVSVPGAWLDLTLNSQNLITYRRGVIARHVTAQVTGAAQNPGAFGLPADSGTRVDRIVLFTAYENGDLALPRLRALVRFRDCPATGSCVTNNFGQVVEIQRWSVI